jgi:murein DD-endopeptidase MepM/ murein hydrolase activator NlpD
MKPILTIHSNRLTGTKQFSLRQVVSAFVLFTIVFVVSSRSTSSHSEQIARIEIAKQAVDQEADTLQSMQTKVDQQLIEYSRQIAKLKRSMIEVESNIQALSEQADIQLPSHYLESIEVIQPSSPKYTTTLNKEIASLSALTQNKQQQLALLENIVKGHHITEQTQISGRPVKWGWLSSNFGKRNDPFTGKPAMHRGIDFAGKDKGDVLATGAGIVTWAGERFGYGLLVEIDHGNGLVTRYGHNSEVKVNIGDVVTKGSVVAAMGSTGRSTGVHVHYEVLKNGKHVDPLAYLN